MTKELWSRLSAPLRLRVWVLLGGNALLLVWIAAQLREGASFRAVLAQAGPDCAPVLLASLGMTGIVCSGAIDLSVGSVIAFAGTLFGVCVHLGASPATCYAVLFLTAGGLSFVNGALVRALGIPAIIVTLGALPLYRGLALIVADLTIDGFSGNVSVPDDAFHLPGKFYAGSIALVAVVVAIVWEASAETPRRWLARGNSPAACRLQGLDSGRILLSAFAVGGVFLGAAALVAVTQIQAIEPARMMRGFELTVVGAVVLGGTNIFGGEGSYLGTILGAFFLYFAQQALIYSGVNPYAREVVIGGAIVLVIGADCLIGRRAKLEEELR